MKFTTVRLLVNNYAACHQFYEHVLGLKPRFGGPDGNYEEFETGNGVVVALFPRQLMTSALGAASSGGSGDDRAVLTCEVDDVDLVAAYLKTHGVALLHGPADLPAWHLRVAHFRDPDGNLIEINTPLKH